MIRFADDAVMGFELQEDAEKVLQSAPQALREVRPDDPPGQDPTGGIRATEWHQREQAGDLRLFRLYPLLGQVASGEMDRQAQDRPAALESRTQTDRRVVSPQSASTGCGATPGAVPETSGPLRLLRHHGQWPLVEEVQAGGQANLAEMAPSAVAVLYGYALGSVYALIGALPTPADQSRPFRLRSETVTLRNRMC